MTNQNPHDMVRNAYGKIARERTSCCCGGAPCSSKSESEGELGLSCGDPVAFSLLRKGDVVIDLGTGAGKDVFLAAERIGESGRAIGVDMTPEMLALAQANAQKFAQRTGLRNVEFRLGQIEALPVEDATADVVISNCVINLSPDKPAVFREIFRVLKPGGKMVVSDIVLNKPLPDAMLAHETLYVACIAGAALRTAYLDAIRQAGFSDVTLLNDRIYSTETGCADPLAEKLDALPHGAVSSITVQAGRPACGCCCSKA